MSLTTWSRWRARVIILSVLVSSGSYGRCFFVAKSTTDLHTGVGVWVGGGACVCGGGGGGSQYLGCVSGGVATVISLGIRSSLGFRFRIRFRVGIRCRKPYQRTLCPHGCRANAGTRPRENRSEGGRAGSTGRRLSEFSVALSSVSSRFPPTAPPRPCPQGAAAPRARLRSLGRPRLVCRSGGTDGG